jgi:hypothetical protein
VFNDPHQHVPAALAARLTDVADERCDRPSPAAGERSGENGRDMADARYTPPRATKTGRWSKKCHH